MLGKAFIKNFKGNDISEFELFTPSRKQLDLLNKDAVEDYILRNEINFVLHAAAKVGGIKANISDPVGYLSENMLMNFNLIEASIKSDVNRFLFVGSSCMYPKDFINPLKEEYILEGPLEPTNEGYALSKICGAKFCEYASDQFNVNYKTIIPCNLFGEHDHFENERSHLIAAIIKKTHDALTENSPSITIWGDGTARREFLYVNDLAQFLVNNLDQFDEFPELMNVGYGSDFSVNEYYSMIAGILGYKGEFKHDLNKPTGMKYKLMDSSRAASFGWKPIHKIKEALKKTCEFYINKEIDN